MATNGMALVGINLSGAEFGGSSSRYGWDYIYPNNAEIDYYASKSMNVIRLPFRWERLQPTIGGALDSAELSRIKSVVDYAASKGMSVILDPHDYGGYNGNLIGSSQVPNASFAAFWSQLAGTFKDSSNVIFGLMNEPNQQSATSWLQSANAAIAAIRQTGATQEILVPGSYWDGAASWTTSDNAAVIGTGIVDPARNYAIEVHQYLDTDSSGTHSTVVSASIGVERLTAITNWAQQNGVKLFLGEFGVGQDATSLTALNNMLSYMNQHGDVWQGATYWGAGPWWGDYPYSIEPANGADKPQMAILSSFAPGAVAAAGMQAPALPDVRVALGIDTGLSATDNITNRALMTGGGDAGATVSFMLDGAAIAATTVADSTGAWSIELRGIADGRHTIQASESNASGQGGASVEFTLDTAAPTPQITSAGGRTATATQTIVGTGEAGTKVGLFEGSSSIGPSVTVRSDGTWSAELQLSAVGNHVITAVDTDTAGNVGTSRGVAFTYDRPPVITSGGGGTTAVYNVVGGAKQITTITATDPDRGDRVSYGLLDSRGNFVASTNGFTINPTTGALSFVGSPSAGLHNVTVMASDAYGGSSVQNVRVNVGRGLSESAIPATPGVSQQFVFTGSQPLTMMSGFQTTDRGGTSPSMHSVLSLAHTLFNGVSAGASGQAVTSMIASHSLQLGHDTIILTDRRNIIDLVNVNRQALLSSPSAFAFT